MPLHIASTNPNSVEDVKETFLILYSSIVDGKLWCPDCVAVDDLLKETFVPADAPPALIVYVGDRASWKSPYNPFRAAPWTVTSIPTIIRIRNSKEDARLVDREINSENLASFINIQG